MDGSRPVPHLVKRVQHALRQRMDRALAVEQLTLAQYAAMASLAEGSPLTNAELARRCFVTPQTMIRIVSDLAAREWIVRRRDPRHGRRILNSITAAGRRGVERADRIAADIDAVMLGGLGAAEVEELASLLGRCLDNLAAD
jgi:DNA-binding MarR family transcriptional regulator